MEYRILIVGCGQLGSRHLQAVCCLPSVSEIEVVDSNPASLELGRARVKEVTEKNPNITFRWLASLDEATKGGDLCILATQADVRVGLALEAIEKLGYKKFILEKVVAQSMADYNRLQKICDEKKISVWVNCKSRAYPSSKRVKGFLNRDDTIKVDISGGNQGLANTGIHGADLFAFYDGCRSIACEKSLIDPIAHVSKRGGHVFDLSGTLIGRSEKGSVLTLTYLQDPAIPVQITVCSPRYRAVVDEMMRSFWESRAENNWKWEKINLEANLMVSHMTKSFAQDILEKNACELPTLKDCHPAHQFILDSLLPHFNRLLKREGEICPVN